MILFLFLIDFYIINSFFKQTIKKSSKIIIRTEQFKKMAFGNKQYQHRYYTHAKYSINQNNPFLALNQVNELNPNEYYSIKNMNNKNESLLPRLSAK